MTKIINRTGQRFGFLVAESRVENSRAGKVRWSCLCDCGSRTVVSGSNLTTGAVISCGCKSSRNDKETHGMTGTRAYRIWDAMRQRCLNRNSESYHLYGGRGISVCERWEKFENFVADMGEPQEGTSIDRWPDNNGNYEPSNCRWATAKEQCRNTRSNKMLEIDGRIQCMAAWVEELRLDADKFRYRLRKGMSAKEAARYASR